MLVAYVAPAAGRRCYPAAIPRSGPFGTHQDLWTSAVNSDFSSAPLGSYQAGLLAKVRVAGSSPVVRSSKSPVQKPFS